MFCELIKADRNAILAIKSWVPNQSIWSSKSNIALQTIQSWESWFTLLARQPIKTYGSRETGIFFR